MSINPNRMIPLHVADAAVAACEAEIQKLREENARLRKAGDAIEPRLEQRMSKVTIWTIKNPDNSLSKWVKIEDYAALKAENERLRKAGDAMARIIAPPTHGGGEWDGEWDAWIDAKQPPTGPV